MYTSILLASVFLSLPGAALAQNLQFKPRVDFDFAAELPRQMAMADFDHDGNLDLATTNLGNGGGRIDVHFGDGHSDFPSSYEIPLVSAEALGVGDFDGDGWVDIAAGVTVWAHQDVHIFRNDHNGGFTAASVVYPLAYGPLGIATADFDGDGNLDIAVASTSSSYALTWFSGNGNMTFGAGHIVPSTSQDSATRLIAADFNNDGKPDMAMARTTGARVFINPLPGFQFQNAFDLPVSYAIQSLAAADVDGDGFLDLLTESSSGHFLVWHGVGDGTFILLHDYAVTGNGTDMRTGDIDMDGFTDVMISSFSGIQIYPGQGGGSFGAVQSVATGVEPMACGLGDWNGDGWLDLAVACSNFAGQAYLSVHERIPPAVTTGTPYCFGDGSGTACPCGNAGSVGKGCGNFSFTSGAKLDFSGFASISNDTLTLTAATASAFGPGLYFQGSTSAGPGVVFGNGLLCVGGATSRLEIRMADASGGSSTTVPIHVFGSTAAGNMRFYQLWYRDQTGFCTGARFNLSNALSLTWGM
ncbi:MAG: VCBS repeat-containing protein [Planctomycetota bacterium]|nr:VCBS repeat-containing protein [Planctomycetota bacterium]